MEETSQHYGTTLKHTTKRILGASGGCEFRLLKNAKGRSFSSPRWQVVNKLTWTVNLTSKTKNVAEGRKYTVVESIIVSRFVPNARRTIWSVFWGCNALPLILENSCLLGVTWFSCLNRSCILCYLTLLDNIWYSANVPHALSAVLKRTA